MARGKREAPARSRKVFLLAPYLGGVGGIERASQLLVRALGEIVGHERLEVFSLRTAPEARELAGGFSGPEKLTLGSKLRFGWKVLAASVRHRPDLLICYLAGLSPVALLARLFGCRAYVVVGHGWEVWRPLGPLSRLALRRARRLWAVSEYTAATVQEVQRIPAANIRVLPHAVPFEVSANDRRKWHGGKLLTVARLERYKGIETVLEALANLAGRGSPVTLTVVGDGPDRARLERITADLGITERVTFSGAVSDTDLRSLYGAADVFLLVSEMREGRRVRGEGLGLVYLEAAAHGLAVIAGSEGGSVEAIVDAVTGRLVVPGDADALARVIEELVGAPEDTLAMGEAGRKWVTSRFSYEQHRRELEELVRESTSAG